jgi:hypothetical protein
VRAGLGLVQLAGLGALVEVPAEAAPDDLVHRGGVVLAAVGVARPAHGEAAVLALAGQAVLEHHHARDDARALQVADVEALDAQRRLLEPERLLQLR